MFITKYECFAIKSGPMQTDVHCWRGGGRGRGGGCNALRDGLFAAGRLHAESAGHIGDGHKTAAWNSIIEPFVSNQTVHTLYQRVSFVYKGVFSRPFDYGVP